MEPSQELPYRGYGNAERLFVMGRILEDKPMGSPQEDDTWWENMQAMYWQRRVLCDIGRGPAC